MEADQHLEDVSSTPIYIRAEFPYMFIPTTDFVFADVIDEVDNQMTSEVLNERETHEEGILENEVEEKLEEKNDLRISQPKYSQLLRDLDFSQTRMVDVTNLLSDEGGNYFTADENEHPKKLSGEERYQSVSSSQSSIFTDEEFTRPSTNEIDQDDLTNAANDLENDLNRLTAIIQEASIAPTDENLLQEKQKKLPFDEDDDTSKQATQNYDLNDHEQEEGTTSPNLRFTTQEENISAIPRLNSNNQAEATEDYGISWESLMNGTDRFTQAPTVLIFSEAIPELHTTPVKEQQSPSSPPKEKSHVNSPPKQKYHYRSRQLSSSSDGDVVGDHENHRIKQKTSERQLSEDEDFHELNAHLKQVLLDKDRPHTTRSNSRTSPNKKNSSATNETWLAMLGKLEREHQERLEKQQQQYEDYMQHLEEKMKQRFDDYLTSTNSLDESIHVRHAQHSAPTDIHSERSGTSSNSFQYRPLARELNNQQNLISDRRTNLSRSQSREDISTLRTELSTKHGKHIADLKLYYEQEIDELKSQLNRSKMGHTSSITRQSMETIERINQENIRLHDEMKDLRRVSKTIEEENRLLKRQIEELRDQLKQKDFELKSSHRNLEEQLHEAQSIKERQALLYKEENEKLTDELQLTRERLLRVEERYRDMENEMKTSRSQGSTNENHHHHRIIPDDLKLDSTMSLNMPTSREYGRFTLNTSKYSSSTITTTREGNFDSRRYTTNGSDDLFRRGNSPRSLVTITDYLNEKPIFPQPYVPPSRAVYSPRKSSPTHHRPDQMPVRDFIDDQIRQSEQLEEKFDDLLKKKRDLESRINRIPTRGLTNTDRQLLDVLEREIDRVEQQISSVKLELRKMNILRTH